jgi:hypothetical protein
LTEFYSSIDAETANYLKAKEYEIVQIGNSYLTDLGKIFKDAQDRLANHKSGTFIKWIKALGISDDTVYNWIHRYNLVSELFGNQNHTELAIVESLPKLLSYEISKPSAARNYF